MTGVGHVSVEGGIRPAVRIQADLARLASYGLGMADLRTAITGANVAGPEGLARRHAPVLHHRRQRPDRRGRGLPRRSSSPTATARRCCLKDVAEVVEGLENAKVGGWYQGTPGRHHRRAAPAGRQRHRDRRAHQGRAAAAAARACPSGVEARRRARPHRHHPRLDPRRAVHAGAQRRRWSCWSCCCSCAPSRATIIAGVALPLSLIATFGVMWFCGFTPRQPVADGADHRHRLRRRRRHRHDREHRAPHGEGREARCRRRSTARARSASPSSR